MPRRLSSREREPLCLRFQVAVDICLLCCWHHVIGDNITPDATSKASGEDTFHDAYYRQWEGLSKMARPFHSLRSRHPSHIITSSSLAQPSLPICLPSTVASLLPSFPILIFLLCFFSWRVLECQVSLQLTSCKMFQVLFNILNGYLIQRY